MVVVRWASSSRQNAGSQACQVSEVVFHRDGRLGGTDERQTGGTHGGCLLSRLRVIDPRGDVLLLRIKGGDHG